MTGNALSRRIAARMAARGWNQADLVRESGLNKNTVSDLLTGKTSPSRRTLSRVEEALELTPGSLVGDGEEVDFSRPFAANPRGEDTSDRLMEIVYKWIDAWWRLNILEQEYARLRGAQHPRGELTDLMFMLDQTKDGRPWTPPWDESIPSKFGEGAEPWREQWWHERQKARASERSGDELAARREREWMEANPGMSPRAASTEHGQMGRRLHDEFDHMGEESQDDGSDGFDAP